MPPTFDVPVQDDFGALADRVERALGGAGDRLRFRRAGDHFLVSLADRDRHLWSPWLHLDIRRGVTAESPDSLFGRVTLSPSLWTGMMFTLFASCLAAIACVLFGYCQWAVGESPIAAWIGLGLLVIPFVILIADKLGRRVSSRQIDALTEPLAQEFSEWKLEGGT